MSVALAVPVTVLGPLAAAVLIVLLRRAAPALALLGALASAAASSFILAGVSGGWRYASWYEWLPGLPLGIVIDSLAALLSATVALVGLFVLVYALGYMARDGTAVRFYAAMSLFLAAMQALVTAGDWLLLLGSWELIGLASYLLIGHWHQRDEARSAATRAFLTTRAADVGLYLAVFLLVSVSGSTVIGETVDVGGWAAGAAGLLLLVAAAAKSAQAPFQGWLAAAMAGPTPVSALLHSATLVAAGVILLLRAFPLLPPGVLLTAGALGGFTAVVAGLTALAQKDLKRLLAASTSSQLGLMLLGLGAGAPAAAAFHLVAHAAMKSALFLGAGVFQHGRGSTEFTRLGGVAREHRFAYAGFAVAGLALAGLPPLAGFWSKDAIVAAAFAADARWLLAPLALAGSLLTALYVSRALRMLWDGEGASASGRSGEADTGETSSGIGEVGKRAQSNGPEGDQAQAGRFAGKPWMGAGLAVLALAAAVLGLLAGPIEELLGAAFPKTSAAIVLGIVVTVGGLAAGWALPGGQLLAGVRRPAERGFEVAGGLSAYSVRPVLHLASATDRLDHVIHAFVSTTGGWAMAAASGVSAGDTGLHRTVGGAAMVTLTLARAVRSADEQGLEALIAALARRTRELGAAARGLQSGLVHRELALAVAGVFGLLVLLALIGSTVPG